MSDGYRKKLPKPSRSTLDDITIRNRYIKHLSQHGDKSIAAAAVNLHPGSVARYCRMNPDFADRVLRAEYKWKATLMEAMMEQGVYGVEEPILHMGSVVGTRRRVQPRILELLVKKAMPEFNPTRHVEHNHSGQIEQLHTDELVTRLSPDEKRELLKFLRAKQIDVKPDYSFDEQKPDVPDHVMSYQLPADQYLLHPDEVDLTEEDYDRLGYEKD